MQATPLQNPILAGIAVSSQNDSHNFTNNMGRVVLFSYILVIAEFKNDFFLCPLAYPVFSPMVS